MHNHNKDKVESLRSRWREFRQINKDPRFGCISSGKFNFDCCDYHRELSQREQGLYEEAIELTAEVFPDSRRVPGSFSIYVGADLVCCLSDGWWYLIRQAVRS